MDKLYDCLQRDIAAFQSHLQQCKEAFDLGSLQNVLKLLTQCTKREIRSLEELQQLAEAQSISDREAVNITKHNSLSDLDGYVSWLRSFVTHLGYMKETFDDTVIVPLCENLYVNEEEEDSECSYVSYHSNLTQRALRPKPDVSQQQGSVRTSIAELAKELFILRRRWALLLTPGPIRAENFSPQSVPNRAKDTTQFAKVLWLVPDIFYKSSQAADLALQWVGLHRNRYRGTRGQKFIPIHTWMQNNDSLDSEDNQRLQHPPRPQVVSCSENQGKRPLDIQAMLRDSRTELMALYWREERAKVREQRIAEVSQRIQSLRVVLHDQRSEVDRLKHEASWEKCDEEEAGILQQKYKDAVSQSCALERQLRLEEYHYRILLGDLMMELEIRPVLIRQIDMIRDRCKEQEEKLKALEDAKPKASTVLSLG